MNAALALDTGTITQFVSDALRRHVGQSKAGAKVIARIANSNERAAENWLQARNAPDVTHFLRLAMEVPELKSAVAQLLNLGDHDPQKLRLMQEIERYAASRTEAGDSAND